MSAQTLQEFLVSISYALDKASEAKAKSSVKDFGKQMVLLGARAAAAAAAVATAVAKMASNLESLYFASARTRASADNIRALEYAVTQLGGSADGARSSMEAFARFLRINPGGETLIQSWGVHTRDTNGKLRDTTAILKDLGSLFRSMPYPQAYARASFIGIDEKTLIALVNGVGRFSNRYREMLSLYGLDTQKATEQSHRFMMGLRTIEMYIKGLGTLIESRLLDIFDELGHRWDSLDQSTRDNILSLGKWIAVITAVIAAGMALFASGPIGWVTALGAAILALWDDYRVWKEGGKSLINWSRWKPELDLATAAAHLLEDAWQAVSKAMDHAYHWIIKIGRGIEGSAGLKWLLDHRKEAGQAAIKGMSHAWNWASSKLPEPSQTVGKHLQELKTSVHQVMNQLSGIPYTHGHPDAPAGLPRGIRNNNPGNLVYNRFTRSLGATGSDAKGFAVFPTAKAGLNAIASNLASYARKGFNTPYAIAHHWSTTDQSAYTKQLADLFGNDPQRKLDMNNPAVINALRNGIVLMENGRNPYVSGTGGPQTPIAQAAAPSLSQVTNITVLGDHTPQATADAIAAQQDRVNERLLRNGSRKGKA